MKLSNKIIYSDSFKRMSHQLFLFGNLQNTTFWQNDFPLRGDVPPNSAKEKSAKNMYFWSKNTTKYFAGSPREKIVLIVNNDDRY